MDTALETLAVSDIGLTFLDTTLTLFYCRPRTFAEILCFDIGKFFDRFSLD
jgi:hypothetical protein